MPQSNILSEGSRVSVTRHFLKSGNLLNRITDRDVHAPNFRLFGEVTGIFDNNGRTTYEVRFDDYRNFPQRLSRSVMKLETSNQLTTSAPVVTPVDTALPSSNYGYLVDGEGDSDSSTDDNEESEPEDLDPNWRVAGVSIDFRLANGGMSNRARHAILVDLPGYQEASAASYFLHFLPCTHLQQVVIPATNAHARSQRPWVDITWPEYLTFIMLNINMMIIKCQTLESYWEEGTPESFDLPRVKFGRYMSLKRYRDIKKWHVFTSPSDVNYTRDNLYQVRSFLEAYNSRLVRAMEPGGTMCIDESMNQWLGTGMPNLKKVPRKPHSIGQEYKCIADCDTCIIMRLEFTGDWKHYAGTISGRDANGDRSIVSTVKRLVEPWRSSGRVIIADSWFGSPEMARKLFHDKGLHSIMQVAKRAYWPKGMPVDDMLQAVGPNYGDVRSMVSTSANDPVFVATYRDLKCKVLVATCSTTLPGNRRQFKDPRTGDEVETIRPRVFDDYESNKSSVDILNNRRDNLLNFHDVMKTQRWELRCLAFFLGIAEANAFSAYKHFANDGEDLTHNVFRKRLVRSLREHIEVLDHGRQAAPPVTRSAHQMVRHIATPLGKTRSSNNYIHQQCSLCKRRTSHRCSCSTVPVCNDCMDIHMHQYFLAHHRTDD